MKSISNTLQEHSPDSKDIKLKLFQKQRDANHLQMRLVDVESVMKKQVQEQLSAKREEQANALEALEAHLVSVSNELSKAKVSKD